LTVKIDGSINGRLMRWIGETEFRPVGSNPIQGEGYIRRTLAFVWVNIRQDLRISNAGLLGCGFDGLVGGRAINKIEVKLEVQPTRDRYNIMIDSPWGMIEREYTGKDDDIDLILFMFDSIRRELEVAEDEGTIEYRVCKKKENEGWKRLDG